MKDKMLGVLSSEKFLFPFTFGAPPERAMKLQQSKHETDLTQEQLFSSSVNWLEEIYYKDIAWVEGGIVTH